MTLREFPGALVLGVLAALAAHTALFGGDHSMGGAYHGALVQVAFLGSVGLLVSYGSLVWSGSRHAADGSVLAARIASRLPNFTALFAGSAFWYALAERIEPEHATHAPLLLVTVVLGAAAWLAIALARGVTRLLAVAVLAACRTRWVPRIFFWVECRRTRPIARRAPLTRRRFARPPPIAIVLCA